MFFPRAVLRPLRELWWCCAILVHATLAMGAVKIVVDDQISQAGIRLGPVLPDSLDRHTPSASQLGAFRSLVTFGGLITNSGSSLVVGLTLRYELMSSGGEIVPQHYYYQNPNRRIGLPYLAAGRTFLVLPLSGNLSQLENVPAQKRPEILGRLASEADQQVGLFSRQKEVSVSIDAILLSDGTFLGANRSRSFERLAQWISAESTLLSDTRTRLDAQMTADDLSKWLAGLAGNPLPLDKASLIDPAFDHFEFRRIGLARALGGLLDRRGLVQFRSDVEQMQSFQVQNIRRLSTK
jgi:hypothetical protein